MDRYLRHIVYLTRISIYFGTFLGGRLLLVMLPGPLSIRIIRSWTALTATGDLYVRKLYAYALLAGFFFNFNTCHILSKGLKLNQQRLPAFFTQGFMIKYCTKYIYIYGRHCCFKPPLTTYTSVLKKKKQVRILRASTFFVVYLALYL